MKQHGFTLIELLVVISIIAVLASFLLPGIAMAKASANTIKCTSSLRQIGLAFYGYADSHNDILPMQRTQSAPVLAWHHLISPYLDGPNSQTSTDVAAVMRGCPAVRSDPYITTTNWQVGYGMQSSLNVPYDTHTCNMQWGPQTWAHPFGLSNISHPSQRALVFDADDWTSSSHCGNARAGIPSHYRHRNKNNYLFVDGHVDGLAWMAGKGQAVMNDPTKY